MIMTDNIKEISSQVKSEIVKLMDDMVAFRKTYHKFEFPETSSNFKLTRELLTKGEFNLAVCGKVKNGKSSLINALVGKEILPVCNDVATSRVFKISHADKESFYVVFGNGNRKQIEKEDLPLYGNQSVINKAGEQEIEDTIAYIQVYTPIGFLPEGVSLIDTPGIGSTYPQHTAITKQYIKMADAALFVLNPTPLENIEVDFLKEIIKVTPGVLFVTTKVDQNSNDSVNETIKRNHQIIEKNVGDYLPFGISMLKMSSTLLLKAAKESEEEIANFNYEVSGYDDVKNAIINLVFLILGYYRSGLAYNACVEHYMEVLKALKFRLDTAQKASSKYEELLSSYERAEAFFKDNMGDTRKKEVLADVETIIKTMKSDFDKTIISNGQIFHKYRNEINDLSDGEIATYSEDLGERVVSDIQKEWDNLTALVQKRIGDVLAKFNEECLMSIPDGLISISRDGMGDPTVQAVQLRDRIGKMRNEMFLGTAITGALSTVVGGAYFFMPALIAPALPVLAPVMVVLGVGTVLWGAISGNAKAKQESLQKNKTQLINYVSETISKCRAQLLDVSLADNKYKSLYQGFIDAAKEQVNNSISDIYERYSKELEAMKKTVLETKQNPQIVLALEHLLKEWSKNKETINGIHEKLETVKPL